MTKNAHTAHTAHTNVSSGLSLDSEGGVGGSRGDGYRYLGGLKEKLILIKLTEWLKQYLRYMYRDEMTDDLKCSKCRSHPVVAGKKSCEKCIMARRRYMKENPEKRNENKRKNKLRKDEIVVVSNLLPIVKRKRPKVAPLPPAKPVVKRKRPVVATSSLIGKALWESCVDY